MHDSWRVSDFSPLGKRTVAGEQGIENALVSMEQKSDLGMPAAGDRRTGQDRGWAGIAAHGVQRQNQFPDHVLSVPPVEVRGQKEGLGERPSNRSRLVLSGHNLAPIIVSAGGTDMVRPL
jgi:hypothetical protein